MKIPKLKQKPFNMDDCMRDFLLHPNTSTYLLEKFPQETARLVRLLGSIPERSVPVCDDLKNGACFDCGVIGAVHDHHVIPEVLGGKRTVPLCEVCHGKVHSKDFTDHRALTVAGMRAAKARGVKFGRPASSFFDRGPIVKLWLEEKEKGRTLRSFCKEHGISTSTLRRAVASKEEALAA